MKHPEKFYSQSLNEIRVQDKNGKILTKRDFEKRREARARAQAQAEKEKARKE